MFLLGMRTQQGTAAPGHRRSRCRPRRRCARGGQRFDQRRRRLRSPGPLCEQLGRRRSGRLGSRNRGDPGARPWTVGRPPPRRCHRDRRRGVGTHRPARRGHLHGKPRRASGLAGHGRRPTMDQPQSHRQQLGAEPPRRRWCGRRRRRNGYCLARFRRIGDPTGTWLRSVAPDGVLRRRACRVRAA